MVSMHSEKAQMCSKPSLRSFPNIAFKTVLSYKTTLKQQLNSEKWNVGYVSAFCWTVLLCCFSIQCFCRCVFYPMHFWCLCSLHLTPHFPSRYAQKLATNVSPPQTATSSWLLSVSSLVSCGWYGAGTNCDSWTASLSLHGSVHELLI